MESLSQLIHAIQIGDDERAESACQALTPDLESNLLQLATGDYSGPEIAFEKGAARWWAIRSLAICGGTASAPLLTFALSDQNGEVRAAAALALGQIYGRLPEPKPERVALWMETIANLLTDELGYVRQAAADALVLFGADAISTLATVLAQAPDGARVRAAYALRKIGTMETAPLLFRYLNDSHYLVHTYAHEGLDELGLFDNVLVTL